MSDFLTLLDERIKDKRQQLARLKVEVATLEELRASLGATTAGQAKGLPRAEEPRTAMQIVTQATTDLHNLPGTRKTTPTKTGRLLNGANFRASGRAMTNREFILSLMQEIAPQTLTPQRLQDLGKQKGHVFHTLKAAEVALYQLSVKGYPLRDKSTYTLVTSEVKIEDLTHAQLIRRIVAGLYPHGIVASELVEEAQRLGRTFTQDQAGNLLSMMARKHELIRDPERGYVLAKVPALPAGY